MGDLASVQITFCRLDQRAEQGVAERQALLRLDFGDDLVDLLHMRRRIGHRQQQRHHVFGDRRLDILHRQPPGAVDADCHVQALVRQALGYSRQGGARCVLGVRRNRVLQVEDDRVGAGGRGLLDKFLGCRGHEQHRAPDGAGAAGGHG